jgi:hypothetical protein
VFTLGALRLLGAALFVLNPVRVARQADTNVASRGGVQRG